MDNNWRAMFHHVGHVIRLESHEMVPKTLCATCSPGRPHVNYGLQFAEAVEWWTKVGLEGWSTLVKVKRRNTFGSILCIFWCWYFVCFVYVIYVYLCRTVGIHDHHATEKKRFWDRLCCICVGEELQMFASAWLTMSYLRVSILIRF